MMLITSLTLKEYSNHQKKQLETQNTKIQELQNEVKRLQSELDGRGVATSLRQRNFSGSASGTRLYYFL